MPKQKHHNEYTITVQLTAQLNSAAKQYSTHIDSITVLLLNG
jgi:hypothetical protein